MSTPDVYDVAIVGGAAAGLAAGIYAARDRYRTVILEKNPFVGGQIMMTGQIENFPGHAHIKGAALMEQMEEQAKGFGAAILTGQDVRALRRGADGLLELEVAGPAGGYRARSVILAPGSRYRHLGVPGEAELRQAGRVSYCAVCDGPLYRDKDVLVVGGGNTAVEDAIYVASQFTRRLILIHRRQEFRAQRILVEELYETARTKALEIRLDHVLKEIVGDETGSAIANVVVENVKTGATESLVVDGVFILVGTVPNTQFLHGSVEVDDQGYVVCDPRTLRTSMPGVFVAGDCRRGAAMQLVTACADGVVAALQLKEYFVNPEGWAHRLPGEASVRGY